MPSSPLESASDEPDEIKRLNKILSSELETAVILIKGNRDKIDKLVDVLLEKNRVTGDELKKIWGDNITV